MNPLMDVHVRGRLSAAFFRLIEPYGQFSPSEVYVDKDRPTEPFRRAWTAAFGQALRDEPICQNNRPTKYLLDAYREATR